MDTDKKPDDADKPKPGLAEAIGDLVVSSTTLLAHSAAEALWRV